MTKEDTKEEIKKAQEKVAKESSKKNPNEKKKEKKLNKKESLEDLSWNKEDEVEGLKQQEKPEIKELETLEEQLAKEKIPDNVKNSEYTKELSHKPVDVLYDQAKALATKAEEKGYLSPTEQKQMDYIAGAIEEKVEGGSYSFTEETAKRASSILQLSWESRNMYKGGTTSNQKSIYKSG
jgi:hypothetical protein